MTDTAAPSTQAAPTTPPAAKPGWRTSEFWLKIAAFALTALYASGGIPTSGVSTQLFAIAATMLGALGYTVARTMAKAKPQPPTLLGHVLELHTEEVARKPQAGFIDGRMVAFLAMFTIVALTAAGFIQGCGSKAKAAEHAAVACAEDEAVKALEPAVQSILTTGGADWENQLLSLGVNGAINELSCAVQFVHDLLGANGSAVAAGSGSVGADEARSRAETFLNDLASGKRSVPHSPRTAFTHSTRIELSRDEKQAIGNDVSNQLSRLMPGTTFSLGFGVNEMGVCRDLTSQIDGINYKSPPRDCKAWDSVVSAGDFIGGTIP